MTDQHTPHPTEPRRFIPPSMPAKSGQGSKAVTAGTGGSGARLSTAASERHITGWTTWGCVGVVAAIAFILAATGNKTVHYNAPATLLTYITWAIMQPITVVCLMIPVYFLVSRLDHRKKLNLALIFGILLLLTNPRSLGWTLKQFELGRGFQPPHASAWLALAMGLFVVLVALVQVFNQPKWRGIGAPARVVFSVLAIALALFTAIRAYFWMTLSGIN